MAHLFDTARRLEARVILSGDRRQHGSVERGSALALLEDEAGLAPAQIKEIRRQSGAYKQAVQELSEGRTASGFKRLDGLGWIKTVASDQRDHLLAREYVAASSAGKSALVVSPTHREGDAITREIRATLKGIGRIDGREQVVSTLANKNLTEAERLDPRSYESGDVLVFHQNAKGFTRGQKVRVDDSQAPVDQAARFQVYRNGSLAVAVGDVLRITRNGATKDGRHRLNNGQRVTVKGFTKAGDLVLTNHWTLARDYGHLTYGYVTTSHASQGKTVDRVLIGQSSASAAASSREQFYVSVSRGRERATIYTDDKKALLESVTQSDDRLSATELLRERTAHLSRMAMQAPLAHMEPAMRREIAYVR